MDDELIVLEQRLCTALTRIRDSYEMSLKATEGNPHFNVLGADLWVDQVRGIITSEVDSRTWDRRDGKNFISTKRLAGIDYLGFMVGRQVYLRVGLCLDLLAAVCRGTSLVQESEFDIARFLNLMVAEPYLRPGNNLPIWVTLALKAAAGEMEDDLCAGLPGLITDHDVLYNELPADAPPYARKLLPYKTGSMDEYCAELLAVTTPELEAPAPAAALDVASAARLFEARSDELENYVRRIVLPAVLARV